MFGLLATGKFKSSLDDSFAKIWDVLKVNYQVWPIA